MKRNEIYLASFPFGDKTEIKLRPVSLLTGVISFPLKQEVQANLEMYEKIEEIANRNGITVELLIRQWLKKSSQRLDSS